MLNNCTVMGRLVGDVEARQVNGANGSFSVGRFTVAVDRPKRQGQNKAETDFITCSSAGKRIETISNYFHKGDLIVVSGRWKTGSYTNQQGQKIYTNELDVADFNFIPGTKSQTQTQTQTQAQPQQQEFMYVPDGDFDGLPFN